MLSYKTSSQVPLTIPSRSIIQYFSLSCTILVMTLNFPSRHVLLYNRIANIIVYRITVSLYHCTANCINTVNIIQQ